MVNGKPHRRPWRERFDEKIDRSGGPDACWPWMGARCATGHGQFRKKGRRLAKAHRLSWEIANGRDVPEGLVVRHACGRGECQNPAHLLIGSQADNMRDAVDHGTRKGTVISDADVALVFRMRADGVRFQEIADRLGISKATAWRIFCGASRSAAAPANAEAIRESAPVIPRRSEPDPRVDAMQKLRSEGMTLRAIGERFGVTESYVCRILKGNRLCFPIPERRAA